MTQVHHYDLLEKNSDDKGLKEINESWDGSGQIPLALNRKLEREIRYLGSNDFAYMSRKLRGHEPAGISVHEMIDDLCKLLKFEIDKKQPLEARLEIFAQKMVDKQFDKLPDDKKREIINEMNFDEHHRKEILDKIINKKEMLLPVIMPMLTGTMGAEVMQGLIISMIAPFIGREAAKQLLVQISTKIPVFGAILGPLLMVGGTGWLLVDMTGPASRKTIPLILYLGVLSFRNGESKEFTENLQNEQL